MDGSDNTRRTILICVLLGAVTMALYWPATDHDFITLDDGIYVYQNAHVQTGLTWENLGWALTTLHFGLWHPLTWVSHMLDCECFGLSPGWHHLTSLLLHAANAVLLFVVLCRMTGALWRSALVAALFALHPLHVESVAWVAERKDVLGTFFVMLTIWAYVRYAENAVGSNQLSVTSNQLDGSRITGHASRITDHRPLFFYLLALLFFACGLMSKPMVVTLPLVLLLLDYWPLKRFELAAFASRLSLPARLLMEKLPFVLAALLTGLITLLAANREGSLASAAQCSITDRIANAIISYARYFVQVFWPGNLAVYYPFPATFSVWSMGGAALLLLGISVAAVCMARRWPYVVVGWLWYLVTLLPVIGLIQLAAYSHADRYTYVPLIGVFVLLVWGAHDLTKRWRYGVMALSVAGSAAIVLCIVLTRQQLGHWKDTETLFRHALEVTENNYLAHNNLGYALVRKGQMDEAISQFQKAIRLMPHAADAYNSLGNALDQKGQMDEAISQYWEALRLKSDSPEIRNNLGVALVKKGQMDEAISQFQESIHLRPDYADAHHNLGIALGKKGQMDMAISQYQEALRLSQKGLLAEGIACFQRALELSPQFPEAQAGLADALLQSGQPEQAAAHYTEALRLNPNLQESLNNLAWLRATSRLPELRDAPKAVQLAQRACKLTSWNQAVFIGTLAAAYAEAGQFEKAVETAQKACDLATSLGQTNLLQRNQELMRLYREGRPVRE